MQEYKAADDLSRLGFVTAPVAPVQKERLRVLVGDQREGHAADPLAPVSLRDGADRHVP